jgi:uridine kinase
VLPNRRAGALHALADLVEGIVCLHPVRVAIDGADAAGKTVLADELGAVLADRGRDVIRASIDGFHRPRAERYRRGRDSPIGYYEDSFDYQLVRRILLDPLGPGGDRTYRTKAFDHRVDQPDRDRPATARANSILLFDGIFLSRPELNPCWDFRIFVAVEFEEILRRVAVRDLALLGSVGEVERLYRVRYIPAQQHYFDVARPAETADVVFWNDNPQSPTLEDRRRPSGW